MRGSRRLSPSVCSLVNLTRRLVIFNMSEQRPAVRAIRRAAEDDLKISLRDSCVKEPTLDPGAVGVINVEGWVQNSEDHLKDIVSTFG